MPRGAHPSPRLTDAFFAEAIRACEEEAGAPADAPEADAAGRAAGGDLQRRILARAATLSRTGPFAGALAHLRTAFVAAFAIALIAAAAAGCGAVAAFFGSPAASPVNVFQALAGLLGVPTLALVAWGLSTAVRPAGAAAAGLLGRAVVMLGGRISHWLDPGGSTAAIARAASSMLAEGGIGRWTVAVIAHALWLAYAAAALALLLFHLGTREFAFGWETTILDQRHYAALTRAVAVGPALFGFPVPDAAEVAASRLTGEPGVGGETFAGAGVRGPWAGLLIGSLVVYGVLPRALLLVLGLVMTRRAIGRHRLDVTLPGYARLRSRLMPAARRTGVVDAERVPDGGDDGPATAPTTIRRHGPVALIGLEIGPHDGDWPPPVAGVTWLDLGVVDDRTSRHAVVDRLRAAVPPPRAAAVVCALDQTPDRGHRAFLDELQRTTGVPALLLLSGGDRLRARKGHRLADRVADWRQMAAAAGIDPERVLEIDLDRLTWAGRDRLARWLGGEPAAEVGGPPIERAFALIVERAARWSGPPNDAERAELHRAIARLYGSQSGRWRALLRLPEGEIAIAGEQLRESAARVSALLPPRLKGSRRWLAAGALAGALGCVAAATLLAPAAIVALPAWAGLGAALAAVLPRTGAVDAPAAEDGDLGGAVAAAALFALVLHVQGRDEATITAILDETLPEADPPPMHEAGAVRTWLGGLADRLAVVLASRREAGR